MISKIKDLGLLVVLNETVQNLHMHEVDVAKIINLPGRFEIYNNLIEEMLIRANATEGTAFVTIDNKVVREGETHRRGGKHFDGNYTKNTWTTPTPKPGWRLPERVSAEVYNGGTLLLSDKPLCKVWTGEYTGEVLPGNDCSKINTDHMEAQVLDANKLYLINSTAIHESLPAKEIMFRNLIRITLPSKYTF